MCQRFGIVCLIVLNVILVAGLPALASEKQSRSEDPQLKMVGTGSRMWDRIQVLDLKTAQQIAVSNNPSIGAAKERVAQAKQRLRQVKAAYWPRIDFAAGFKRVDLSGAAVETARASARLFDPAAEIDDPQNQYLTRLSATWLLFDGFERRFAAAAASFSEKENREALLDAQRTLLAAVSVSYYSALLARENVAIAKADEAFNQRQLQEAKARFRVGTGSLSDTLNFEVQINSTRALRFREERDYEAARYGLAALLGMSSGTLPAHVQLSRLEKEVAWEMTVPATDPLIQFALEHRPDILRGGYAIERAHSEEKVAKAEFYPTLDFVASADGENDDTARFRQDDFGNTIGFNLTYNLFSGGASRAKLGEARNKTKEAKQSYRDLTNNLASEIQRNIVNLKLAQNELRLQRSNAELVQQNRDLVEKEYNAGQASLVRLNEAQRDLTTAQARLALALVSLRQAWQDLEVSTARILSFVHKMP